MVPKVLSSQLILQPALILLPEQEDLLFQPHWTYWRGLGCSGRVTFCFGTTQPISSASAYMVEIGHRSELVKKTH